MVQAIWLTIFQSLKPIFGQILVIQEIISKCSKIWILFKMYEKDNKNTFNVDSYSEKQNYKWFLVSSSLYYLNFIQ